MKQVLIRDGAAVVEEVPAPLVGSRNLLVRVSDSCVSVGTEMAGLRLSGMPLYRRALKQPENARRVLQLMREQGVGATLDRVRGKLAAGSATGYSAAGRVIGVGGDVEGFREGDLVACAGAGLANHAEVIDVPVNLCVRIPDGVDTRTASTVTLGAIALQGVRRAQPTLGETFVVIGLGILGQIAVQLLQAAGCRVIGSDPDTNRLTLAREAGMARGVDPSSENLVDCTLRLTDGFGADGVIVTAAAAGDEIIGEAARATRRKGRVVLVGDVGLGLERADWYAKELDFLISTSYGPGRYDPTYEEGGHDYPIAYVRWTENRNMEAYLQQLARGAVDLRGLPAEAWEVDRAGEAYARLQAGGAKPLLVYLDYPEHDAVLARRIDLHVRPAAGGVIRVGLAGPGAFAQGVHLPNLARLHRQFALHAVSGRTGANAKAVAHQHGARYATTEYRELLDDPDIDLVLIATRHDLHGSMVLQALAAGKHVFVEKPLTLNGDELDRIEAFYREREHPPLLMTGYNRRFSPAMARARELVADSTTPLLINYRMNAGFIAPDNWVQTVEGGGRNLGEACHIYDLFNYLTGSEVTGVSASCVVPRARQWRSNDNFVATVEYADGSLCTLTYTAMGCRDHAKERMEVYADGCVLGMDDYRELTVTGRAGRGWSARHPEKGQFEELRALARALRDGGEWPISLRDQLSAARTGLLVEAHINAGNADRGAGEPVRVEETRGAAAP